MDTMQSYSFLPIIPKATRFPPPSSLALPSLLDHIWTNRLGVCTSGIILLEGTDHCPVFVKLPIIQSIENKIKLTFRLHNPVNIDHFQREVRLLVQDVEYRSDVGSLTLILMSEL